MTYGTLTPPGWYPDPLVPAGSQTGYRWWDGAAWTPYVHVPVPLPELSGKDDPLYWLLPVGRPWQAIVAGYLGLVCLVTWLFGPVGVVCGAISAGFGVAALHVAKKRQAGGQARAVFGIVAGGVSIVASIWLMNASG